MTTRAHEKPAVALIILGAVFIAAFYGTMGHVLNTWFSARGSHGPIIVGISVYMVWIQRHTLGKLTAEPRILWGSVVTVFGCLVLIAGKASFTLIIQYAAFILTLLGLVLTIGGLPYLKVLGLPIVYLSFTFPFFSAMLERVSDQLQSFTALIAYYLLMIGGMPVLLSGQYIEIPTVSMEVARECNGVNHMVALVALAVPLAFWSHRTWQMRAVLIAAAVVIAQIANGIRVAAIGYLSYYVTGSQLHGPYDILYVPFVFFFGLVLLIATSKILSRFAKEDPHGADGNGESATGSKSDPAPGNYNFRSVLIALLILAGTGIFLYAVKPKPAPLSHALESFPLTIGQWTGDTADLTEAPFTEFSADEEIKRVYKDRTGRMIRLYAGYFPMQDDDKKVLGYRYDHLHRNAETVNMPTKSGIMTVKRAAMQKRGKTTYTYFCYVINGKVIADWAEAKKAVIADVLLNHRSSAAIIVLSHTVSGQEDTIAQSETGAIIDMMDQLKNQLVNKA